MVSQRKYVKEGVYAMWGIAPPAAKTAGGML